MFAFAVVNANVFTCNKDRKIRLGYYIYIYTPKSFNYMCSVCLLVGVWEERRTCYTLGRSRYS